MGTEEGAQLRLFRRLSILVLVLVAVVAVLAVLWVVLQWSIAEHVYSLKGALDWFGITFYHDYTFVAGALFALLVIYPRPGGSDLRRLGTVAYRLMRPYDEEPRPSEKMNAWLWGLWQMVKWVLAFYLFVTYGGFLLLGPIMNPISMLAMGLGSWGSIPRIFVLPLTSASGADWVALMPSLTIQYAVLSYVASAVLLVLAIRVLLRLLTNLAIRQSDIPLRNLLTLVALILLGIILGAPYWLMNVATPYVYGIVWSAFLLTLVGIVYLYRRKGVEDPRRTIFKGLAVVLAILLIVQVGIGAFYYFNWNNNYLAYQWHPQTEKQITVTRWAAGLDSVNVQNISRLPTSNPTTTLDLVRQWDQQAASVINTKEIGAYNWMQLASSEIVFYNGTEYWVSPTTPSFPSTDWISEHLIYTHASKVLVVNTHNGTVVPTTSAFGIASEPPIYYGEGGGFAGSVYVHLPGYDEIQNVSYRGTSDYTLSGWQKAMWFTFSEGQLGFAFSGQPLDMLWNRNIFSRVGGILISGLTMDPSAYIVSDGKSLYYAVQVYIDYPLQSGFSASPYLRFFGVVLVNIADGSMQGYTVSNLLKANSTDFLTQFYQNYYSTWKAPPAWLVPQIRYPEQLLGSPSVSGQLDYDFLYHVNDPFVFRSGTQFYERAADSTVQYIPFAVGNSTYFVGLQLVQYQGVVSKNLGALYVAYGGDRLGQIYVYENPSTSSLIIGPAAAENALSTNQQVRTQETLLPNYRLGSYLLYSVGGQLTYFVAVYTNPGSSGVVTQLPFMTAVNPSTGAVGIGSDATSAFDNLGISNGTSVSTPTFNAVVHQIDSLISSKGYSLVNATSVNPTVWVNEGSVSLGSAGSSRTVALVASLLQGFGPGSAGNAVYAWRDSSGNLNFGVIRVPTPGVAELYYVTIRP